MSGNVRSGKNYALALALAGGATAVAAGEQVGVCERTVRRKLGKPGFRRLVAKLRNQLITTALGRMADNMILAGDALVELVREKDPMVRLRAARAVVTLCLRMRDSVELNERMDDVERELALKRGDFA